MAVIKVPTSFNIDVDFEIPEFYRRLLALLIDILLIFFYYKIAYAIFLNVAKGTDPFQDDTPYNLWAIFLLIIVLPILLYHALLEITMNGQSVGKKILGLKVVNENGGRPGISQFLIRWLLRDIWFFLLFIFGINTLDSENRFEGSFMIILSIAYFIIDIILVISSKKGQRLGDILAHTILIRTNSRGRIEETVFQEIADTYTPVFPQIMQLSDKDINAIKSILETAKKKGDFHMAAAATEKIKGHLKIESSLSPFEFLDVLLKDYNYLSVK